MPYHAMSCHVIYHVDAILLTLVRNNLHFQPPWSILWRSKRFHNVPGKAWATKVTEVTHVAREGNSSDSCGKMMTQMTQLSQLSQFTCSKYNRDIPPRSRQQALLPSEKTLRNKLQRLDLGLTGPGYLVCSCRPLQKKIRSQQISRESHLKITFAEKQWLRKREKRPNVATLCNFEVRIQPTSSFPPKKESLNVYELVLCM